MHVRIRMARKCWVCEKRPLPLHIVESDCIYVFVTLIDFSVGYKIH